MFRFYPQFTDPNSHLYKPELKSDDVLNPCGLFPLLYQQFDIKINKLDEDNNEEKELIISRNDIVDSDILKNKFKKPEDPAFTWLDITDPRFVSFMNTPAFNDFEVLNGIIDEDLEIGNYSL